MESTESSQKELGLLAAECDARGNVYGFLSRCFEREVDGALVAQCAAGWSAEFADEALTRGIQGLCGAITACEEADLEDLAVDFNRVFFGMGPLASEKAFPYESVYTSEGGLMMQDAYSAVLEEYRGNGFAKNPAFSEPEDHIAVELAYMAELCRCSAQASREGRAEAAEEELRRQVEFLGGHLLSWVKRFAADVRNASQVPFYPQLASATEAFLEADARLLEETVL